LVGGKNSVIRRFWIVRWEVDVDREERSAFRVFTKIGYMLTSLQRREHVSWLADFTIYYIDVDARVVRDVTQNMIAESVLHTPTKEEWEAAEPNAMPHSSQ
jgi:hypothetical protein